MSSHLIRNPEVVQEIFQRACDRRELLILVTPYLRFESSFLRMEEGEFHAAATMGREDALYGLRSPELRMRFPHGVSFVEAPTQLRGFGMCLGRRSLRLALPEVLQDRDHRGAYRVDRVGRVPVTFSTPRYDLVIGTLVDISTTGARIFSTRDFHEDELIPGQEMAVTINLTDTIRINTRVTLRHVQLRTFGVEFRPRLDEDVLHPLSRWVFEKREEDLGRISRRGIEAAGTSGPARNLSQVPTGLLLVSGDPTLEETLRELLGGLQPLVRVGPTMSAVRDAFTRRPALTLLHVTGLGLDARRRVRMLVEPLQGKVPFLLVGTGVEGGALLELGQEVRAAASIVYSPERATFFQRLVQGVLRRTYEGGESPLVPADPSPD